MPDNIVSHVEALNEDPHMLAKRAIRLLEQRIYKDFGLKVRLGAELEFTLVPRDKRGLTPDSSKPIKYPEHKKYDNYKKYLEGQKPSKRFTPARERSKINAEFNNLSGLKPVKIRWLTDPLFPESNIVCYSYSEFEDFKYEVVIPHTGFHDKYPPDGRRAEMFARSIEALRNTIQTASAPARCFAKDPKHNAVIKEIAKDWQAIFDGHMIVDNPDTHRYIDRTHGLHINISLVANDGKSLPKQFYVRSDEVTNSKAYEALEMGEASIMNEGSYLLITDKTAERRHKMGWWLPAADDDDSLAAGYLEIKFPPANCNPYYATMLALMGIYQTLDKGKYDKKKKLLSDPEGIPDFDVIEEPADFKHAFFSGERRILRIMNEMEKGLGDRFEAAIRKNPPDQDKSMQSGLPQRFS